MKKKYIKLIFLLALMMGVLSGCSSAICNCTGVKKVRLRKDKFGKRETKKRERNDRKNARKQLRGERLGPKKAQKEKTKQAKLEAKEAIKSEKAQEDPVTEDDFLEEIED